MFFPSRARLASWHPPMQRRRNLENSAVPTLLARGSRLAFRATMCRTEGDLEACWNRILTIFDPYTFSHNQGQVRPPRAYPRAFPARQLTLRYRTNFAASARSSAPCQQWACVSLRAALVLRRGRANPVRLISKEGRP